MYSAANRRRDREPAHREHNFQEPTADPVEEMRPPLTQSAMDLQQALACAVSLRTGGRVRLPQVQFLGARVVLSGWAASHHVVQLALAGLLEEFRVLGLDRPDEIELNIEVASVEPLRRLDAASIRPR